MSYSLIGLFRVGGFKLKKISVMKTECVLIVAIVLGLSGIQHVLAQAQAEPHDLPRLQRKRRNGCALQVRPSNPDGQGGLRSDRLPEIVRQRRGLLEV